MKKILLSLSVALATMAASAQVQRTVLIEEFTQASCGPCAAQNPAFNALLSTNIPNKVVEVKYQTSWPGVDPMNAQNPTDVANRVTRYDVTGVPEAVVDGDTLKNPATSSAYAGAPANITQALINTEYAITTPIQLTGTYSYNSTTDSFTSVITVTNMSTTAVNASAVNNLKLMYALVEMNINFATPPGTNGETAFFYVMRKMEPSIAGSQLPDVLAPGTPYTFTIKDKAPSYIYDKNQMAAAYFVQDMGNNKVYQAGLAKNANTVDVSASWTGSTTSTSYCNATINPSVLITNVGTTPITSASVSYTVNGTAGASQSWTGNLATGQSTTVTMPAIVAPTGTNVYNFTVTNLNGGAIDFNGANNQINSIVTKVVGTALSPFIETFESSAVGASATTQSLNNNSGGSYVVDKTISTTLTQKLGGYGTSDKSYRFRFYSVNKGVRMGLVFYKNNMTTSTFQNVKFDYAYNDYADATPSTAEDTLSVKVSSDCGVTWTEIWNKSAAALKTTTVAAQSTAYYPLITEWMTATADLPAAFQKVPELLVMFEGQSGFGNNLYLDNIHFDYPLAINTLDVDNLISVYPNPASVSLNVKGINGNATFTIVDLMGRVIKSNNINNITDIAILDIKGLAKGSYFLKINQVGKSVTKSIVITE